MKKRKELERRVNRLKKRAIQAQTSEPPEERVAAEVMQALFARLPDDVQRDHDFELSDGTKCWIKKFHPPRKSEEGGLIYGFDVKFSPDSPLTHLEFSVRCSGWERSC